MKYEFDDKHLVWSDKANTSHFIRTNQFDL